MIYYKKEHEEMFFNEDTLEEISPEDMDDLKLYEGIIEGLSIALEKVKELENKT
jgi:hypothetical protein